MTTGTAFLAYPITNAAAPPAAPEASDVPLFPAAEAPDRSLGHRRAHPCPPTSGRGSSLGGGALRLPGRRHPVGPARPPAPGRAAP